MRSHQTQLLQHFFFCIEKKRGFGNQNSSPFVALLQAHRLIPTWSSNPKDFPQSESLSGTKKFKI